MQMKADVYPKMKFTFAILVILGQFPKCVYNWGKHNTISDSKGVIIGDICEHFGEWLSSRLENVALVEKQSEEKDQIYFEVDCSINIWELVFLTMELVFMSCVKDTPQETALGAYCTAKWKIKLHDHSFSCCINGCTHIYWTNNINQWYLCFCAVLK